jgi:UTP--glucose-1-phosphate uridylyltransferase
MLRVFAREEFAVSKATTDGQFAPFVTKMRRAGLPNLIINVFRHYYEQLLDGATGYIPGDEALPVDHLPDFNELNGHYAAAGQAALDRTIILKLNGGLGTSMGMHGPKSLLTAKDELSFLDIIVQQVLHLRQQSGARLPLVLMDSFNTHRESCAAIERYEQFVQDVPLSFLQHKVPKIRKSDLMPVNWPADRSKEWCPPGHGDIYAALTTSGTLDKLLAAGYEYAFISNSDNLGAILDVSILGYFAAERLPFLMEVADRTRADSKGGHLARRPDGQLILREIAQCPSDELEKFQDVERYRYFNTNNLWLHLPTLRQMLDERHGVLGLPLIRNEKPVDPTDLKSFRVYQLETAMGSAIAIFAGAQAMRVPRERFVPIKKNSDLLVLWSDVYHLTKDLHLELEGSGSNTPHPLPLVYLDDRYYQMINDMKERFPYGAPSLRECTELRVEGNVYFGKNVVIQGKVKITNPSEAPLWIEDGTVLRGA